MNLRNIMVLVVAIAALAVVPASAGAKQSLPEGVYVCNTAHSDGSGDLSVLTSGDVADPQGGLKADSSLGAMNNGNLNAALHSKALAVCGAPFSGVSGNY